MAGKDINIGAEFLLAEFNAIQQRAIQIEQSKASNINFYLVIVAATIAGVPGIIRILTTETVRGVLIAIFVFISIIGILTLEHSVNQATNTIRLYRRAGKIRRYFLDQDSDIKAYLPFEASDSLPRIYLPISLAYRGAEVTVFAVNIASVSITFAMILSFNSWAWSVVAAIVAGGIAWFLQTSYLRKKLQRSEELAKRMIAFPDAVE